MSRFKDARNGERCEAEIDLRDGSTAQCGRRRKIETLCTQHAKMMSAFSCKYCGGNDQIPPRHCTDCTRPKGTQ